MRAQEFIVEYAEGKTVSSSVVYHGNQGGIHRELITPMWWTESKQDAINYATQGGADGWVYSARLTCKNPYVIKPTDETNTVLEKYKQLEKQGYDSIYDSRLGDWIPFNSKDIHLVGKPEYQEGQQDLAEGTYDSPTHNIKRRPLNVPLLIQKGAIFVTHPHGEQGWETGANVPDWQFSLITLHNVYHEFWCADAKKYLKPKAYNQAAKQINQISDGKYNQILWSIEKLGLGDEAFLDNVKENRMSGINVATAIQNTPPAWQQWISTLPQQLAQEFVDERPSPDATDIQEYTKLKLASPQPRVVNVSDLLKHPRNQYMIGLAPDDVVADINQKWGLQIASGKKYEPTPGRHRDTAKLSGATAAPSVMINGVITFGVGRFTAAALRGDRTMQVWDLRG